jgi:hypothetical protein
VREIGDILRTVDGTLEDSLRVEFAVQRVVEYLYAAKRQQKRLDEWLYEPERRAQPTQMPLDQGPALCEAHFLFVCWDSIRKTVYHLRQNAYCLVTPREVSRRYRDQLEHYRQARDHLEHLTERYPGKARSDWQGDRNAIRGSVAGIRRTGQFVFQGRQWDVTEATVATLENVVTAFVNGIAAELRDGLRAYQQGESAVRRA